MGYAKAGIYTQKTRLADPLPQRDVPAMIQAKKAFSNPHYELFFSVSSL